MLYLWPFATIHSRKGPHTIHTITRFRYLPSFHDNHPIIVHLRIQRPTILFYSIKNTRTMSNFNIRFTTSTNNIWTKRHVCINKIWWLIGYIDIVTECRRDHMQPKPCIYLALLILVLISLQRHNVVHVCVCV